MSRFGWAIFIAGVLASAGCVADRGPLPYVPSPAEAYANARVRDAFDALRPLVGDAPLECNSNLRGGQVVRVGRAKPDALATWFACASAASAARRPFLVVLDSRPSSDGSRLTGVFGRPDGTVRVFNYSAGCCFPPRPQLSTGPCEAPSVRADHGGLYGIRCANEDASGIVPAPELSLRGFPLPPILELRLRAATGDGFLDCGFEVLPSFHGSVYVRGYRLADAPVAFGCAEAASASRRPFQLLLQQESDRSLVVTGLVGTSAGVVSRLRYDSAGTGPRGEPTFELFPCARPALVRQEDSADVGCEAPSSPAPPSRRRPGS